MRDLNRLVINRIDVNSETETGEAALVEQARENDLQAFESLYRMHSARIHGLCYRLCSDREVAEDLTQEAFVLAWRKLGNFRGESAFGSWLYRIATNVALSHLRRRKLLMTSLDQVSFELDDRHPGYDLKLSLEAAIAKLPEGARVVFVLYSIEGYSHKEISQELKIAVGSSKAQLHRARQLLKNLIGSD